MILLKAVSKKTGVQFRYYDEESAKKEVSLDFRGEPLLEGIKRIISPLNFAFLYNDSGNINIVIIMREGSCPEFSVKPEDMNNYPGDKISPESEEDVNSPLSHKSPPLDKESTDLDGPSLSEEISNDGPPNLEVQEIDGPPEGVYTGHSPPESHDEDAMQGPPGVDNI